jgi:hypothetical protein
MRRKVGGAPWSAHLVEHANGVEVPEHVAPTRAALDAYVGDLRNWLAGILHWHRATARYAEAELIRRRWSQIDAVDLTARSAASGLPSASASAANRSPISR